MGNPKTSKRGKHHIEFDDARDPATPIFSINDIPSDLLRYDQALNFDVDLSTEQLLTAGNDLSKANHDLKQADDLKKSEMAEHNVKIKSIKQEIERLADVVSRRKETKNVMCRVVLRHPDLEHKTIIDPPEYAGRIMPMTESDYSILI